MLIFNSLSNKKILAQSKLKKLADDKTDGTQKLKFVSGRVENILGKEKCWLPAFSPFPEMFSKAIFLRKARHDISSAGFMPVELKTNFQGPDAFIGGKKQKLGYQ